LEFGALCLEIIKMKRHYFAVIGALLLQPTRSVAGQSEFRVQTIHGVFGNFKKIFHIYVENGSEDHLPIKNSQLEEGWFVHDLTTFDASFPDQSYSCTYHTPGIRDGAVVPPEIEFVADTGFMSKRRRRFVCATWTTGKIVIYIHKMNFD
jgi:hypothetical protein